MWRERFAARLFLIGLPGRWFGAFYYWQGDQVLSQKPHLQFIRAKDFTDK